MAVRAAALIATACSLAAPLSGAAEEPPSATAPAERSATVGAVVALRLRVDPQAPPINLSWWERRLRGRPVIELKGRTGAEDAPGPVHEYAVFDEGAGRVVTYVYFPHASRRQAGEPIMSLSEISQRADALARLVLPGEPLELAGIQRYRASGEESVYYEARYAPTRLEIPFFDPPVRLLLDASTGRLFRFDLEPDWLDPSAQPRAMISRQAAERVAALVLRARDLSAALGAGAAFDKTGQAELFLVRPNDWLGFQPEDPAVRVRAAWVVPFRLAGAGAGPPHSLFIDAASGRALGGVSAQETGAPAR